MKEKTRAKGHGLKVCFFCVCSMTLSTKRNLVHRNGFFFVRNFQKRYFANIRVTLGPCMTMFLRIQFQSMCHHFGIIILSILHWISIAINVVFSHRRINKTGVRLSLLHISLILSVSIIYLCSFTHERQLEFKHTNSLLYTSL